MRATVVINARASRAGAVLPTLHDALAARDIAVDSIVVVKDERALRSHVRRARRARYDLAIVGGGDGSQTTAVDELAGSETALGVLPLGTGNSFALTLGVGEDLDRALDIIAAQRVVRVDLGVVNGTHFANFATIGLSAEIAANASHRLKAIAGPIAYVFGAFAPLFRHRPFRARIRAGREKYKIETRQIVIANGRYFGKQPIAPDASIVDEHLALFTTTGLSHAEIARTYLAMGLGVQDRLPDAIELRARAITVKAKPPQRVSIDGNMLGRTPAKFSVAPRALRVCVPAEFDDRS